MCIIFILIYSIAFTVISPYQERTIMLFCRGGSLCFVVQDPLVLVISCK